MIDPRASDMLLYVTAVTVAIGMIAMLFGLLVPRERLLPAEPAVYSSASSSLAEMIAHGPAVVDPTIHIDAPPELVKESTFAEIVAEAKRNADPDTDLLEARAESDSAAEYNEPLRAPLVNDLPDDPARTAGPADRTSLSKRITWPAQVDETAVDCDLPTRLRLIEGLSFIGGNWSIEILARAYEQELDANVRGAIFVALRDARSAA